jgi:DNA primase
MADTLRDISRRVREQADIVGIVERYVPLKRAGASFKGHCPFHKEKTPSFNVVPAKGIFHCFGCGAGGSAIDFIMRIERVEFIDALKILAKELGIEVPEARGGPPADPAARDAADRHRRSVQSVNDFALEWFRGNLRERRHPAANEVVAQRDITPEMVETFQLGAALEGWDHLVQAAGARGFSDALLIDAGLAVRSETRGTVYDRFRDRLIFPIFDHLGRTIGFGGRRIGDDPDTPKYMNSAETELYKKSRSLYALHLAQPAITESGTAILTEGYMDTLMAHRFGFANAVASLGTALTSEQARLLKRFARRVLFLYDGDTAGRNAMLKGGGPLLEAGLDVRVIVLPPGDDPDSFLRREGPDALRARIESAVEFFDFALDTVSAEIDLRSLEGQGRLVELMAPFLIAMRNEVAREGAIARMLGRLGGLPRQAVDRLLDRQRHRAPGEVPSAGATAPTDFDALDRVVLRVMLESFEALQVVRHHLAESWLRDSRLEPWILFLLHENRDAEHAIEDAREAGELPADPSVLTAILADPRLRLGDPIHTGQQILARMKKRHFQAIARQLIRALGDMQYEFPDRTLRMIHEECLLAFQTDVPGYIPDTL